MNGRRLPLHWPGRIRSSQRLRHRNVYSLLDAAALASTSQINLSDHLAAPDFTAVSLYKIFGFPDLGALVVRKASSHVLTKRRYFGGGTVDMVINGDDTSSAWCARKETLHERLEDGTPPFHSLVALGAALNVHEKLYGSMENVSRYTCALSKNLFDGMSALNHANGLRVCEIYAGRTPAYGDRNRQGPTIAFNVRNSVGDWIGKSDIEQLAIACGIQLRTGGVCNPGGIASSLDLSASEIRENFAEGLRCGNDVDVLNGKPTGIVRVSLGAMSSVRDVEIFLGFLNMFVDRWGDLAKEQPARALRPSNMIMKNDAMKFAISFTAEFDNTNSQDPVACPVAGCNKICMSREERTSHYRTHRVVVRNLRKWWGKAFCQR